MERMQVFQIIQLIKIIVTFPIQQEHCQHLTAQATLVHTLQRNVGFVGAIVLVSYVIYSWNTIPFAVLYFFAQSEFRYYINTALEAEPTTATTTIETTVAPSTTEGNAFNMFWRKGQV